MKKLLFLLLCFVSTANAAAPVASFTPNRTTGIAPLWIFLDGTGTTDADFTQGTGTTFVTNGAQVQGATTIAVSGDTKTILVGDSVQFGDDLLHRYVVTTGTTGAGNIVITPGIIPVAGVGNGVTVTIMTNTSFFHSLSCVTNFGDANAGTWTNGHGYNTSKNMCSGELCGHIYETPGTYIAASICYDGTNWSNTVTNTITVYDPEDATHGWGAANKTACIANGATPVAGVGGCPAVTTCGTANICQNQSDYKTAITNAIAAGATRILFRRGDTFTSSSTTNFTMTTTGPGMIGAYGTGAKPIVLTPTVSATSYANVIGHSDWRVVDISYDGTGSATSSKGMSSGSNTVIKTTILRVDFRQYNYGLSGTGSDGTIVSDSTVTSGVSSGGSAYGWYCQTNCIRSSLLGSSIDLNASSSHDVRLQGVTKMQIANNTLAGGLGASGYDPITVRGNTQYVVLSDNKFSGNTVTVNPQSTSFDELQQDVIIERNWFAGNISGTASALSIQGTNIEARNNVFNLSNMTTDRGITVVYAGTLSPMPTGIKTYNNTFYTSDTQSSPYAIQTNSPLDATCTLDAKNNLVYMPNSTSGLVINNSGSTCVTTGANGTLGNSSNTQLKSTNPFTTDCSTLLNCRIPISSYAADGTTNTPQDTGIVNTDDFFHCKAIDGKKRAGAMVPAANARCFRSAP